MCSRTARGRVPRRRARRAARGRPPRPRLRRSLRLASVADSRRLAQQADGQPVEARLRHRPPVSTDHMSATSSTLRAIGPTVSSVGQSGKTPSIGISPHCDLRPTTSQPPTAAGSSSPCRCRARARRARPRARPPSPIEEPPVVRPGCAGLWHVPYHSFWPSTLQANSGRCVLPMTTAPASTSRWTADGVPLGDVIGVEPRAVGRADSRRVEQILDRERPARERPGRARRARPA